MGGRLIGNTSKEFDAVFKFTQQWEGGGKLHKVSGDPGGWTKYGVSLRFLEDLPLSDADFNEDGVITWLDIKALSEQESKVLFKKYFWDKAACSLMQADVAAVVFDSAVNCGRGRTVKWLQSYLRVGVDGVVGPITRAAITKQVSGFNSRAIEYILAARDEHYMRLGRKDRYAKFLDGWLARGDDLERLALDNHFSRATGHAPPEVSKKEDKVMLSDIVCPHCGGGLKITVGKN